MKTPGVTVVIPAFNAAHAVSEAIGSVREQGIALQLVVVDDGSTDDTPAVVTALGDVTYIRQENRGPAAARNRGIAAAAAPLIAFLDADDVWTPGRLRLLTALLDESPAAGMALGTTAFETLDAGGRWVAFDAPRLIPHLGAALVRREVFEKHGRFDESLRASEDVDWFLRVRDGSVPIAVTREVVQVHRRHGGNMTRGRDLRELQFMEVLKRSLDRRRRGTS